jgi:hypothetical protein
MSDDYCGSKWTPGGDSLPWHCTRSEGHAGPHRALVYNIEWTDEEADDD